MASIFLGKPPTNQGYGVKFFEKKTHESRLELKLQNTLSVVWKLSKSRLIASNFLRKKNRKSRLELKLSNSLLAVRKLSKSRLMVSIFDEINSTKVNILFKIPGFFQMQIGGILLLPELKERILKPTIFLDCLGLEQSYGKPTKAKENVR